MCVCERRVVLAEYQNECHAFGVEFAPPCMPMDRPPFVSHGLRYERKKQMNDIKDTSSLS